MSRKADKGEERYERQRAKFIEHIKNLSNFYESLEEATERVRDPKLGERLLNDPEVQFEFKCVMIERRSMLRRSMFAAAIGGDSKAGKTMMSMLAPEKEWARINGKPFSQLTLGTGEGASQIVIVPEHIPAAQLKHLLAEKTAVTTDAEEVKEEDDEPEQTDKIEFEEE